MEVAQHHQHDLLLLSLGQLLPLHGSLRLQLQPPHPLHLAQQQLLLLLQHPQRHVPGAPPAERARVCGAEKALLVDSVDPAVVPVLRLSQGPRSAPGDDAAVVAGAAGLLEAREVGAQLRDLPPDVLLLAVVLALVLLPVLRRVGAPPQLLELPAELPEVGGQLVDLVPLRVQLGLGGLDLLLEHRGHLPAAAPRRPVFGEPPEVRLRVAREGAELLEGAVRLLAELDMILAQLHHLIG
mmetsp:Transcript_90094/g.258029  ORF Transcript_90094/g.258029 Transcript_90094/m.258029 type:complete len:239 (+) Transcript_90094:1495-2211(+)